MRAVIVLKIKLNSCLEVETIQKGTPLLKKTQKWNLQGRRDGTGKVLALLVLNPGSNYINPDSI